MLRATKATLRDVPQGKTAIDRPLLRRLCQATLTMGLPGRILRCALSLGYFAFLRQSNLAPPTRASFDPTRHSCRQDVRFAPPGLIFNMKWAKNMQHVEQGREVPLPVVEETLLCPVQSFRDMCSAIPAARCDPLLCWPGGTPVTSSWLVSNLKTLIAGLGLRPADFSLHSLRRGGATAAFAAGVDEISIQRHGGWRSESVRVYISSPEAAASPVASALAKSSY